MTKGRFVSLFSGVMAAFFLVLGAGSCMNPVVFDESTLLTIDMPENKGYGSGWIQIINESSGSVQNVAVYDSSSDKDPLSIDYMAFDPPAPIDSSVQKGLVPVVGTEDVPLAEINQPVEVVLYDNERKEMVVVKKSVSINNWVAGIRITEEDLAKGQETPGSKVTIKNDTTGSTVIMSLSIYDKVKKDAVVIYYLDNVPGGESRTLYVFDTRRLPIVDTHQYYAELLVYSEGDPGRKVITKEFSPDGALYGSPDKNKRDITLNDEDLGPIVPVTGMAINPSPYELLSSVETDGSDKIKIPAYVNLDDLISGGIVEVTPSNATKKGLVWTLVQGGAYVSLQNNILTVTGIAAPQDDTVILQARIPNAQTDGSDFTADITFRLTYDNELRSEPVKRIVVNSSNIGVGSNKTLNLKNLVHLDPPNANINGTLITKDQLTWSIVSGSIASITSDGFTLKAGNNTGSVTVRSVLPAAQNDGEQVYSDITIKISPSVDITMPW